MKNHEDNEDNEDDEDDEDHDSQISSEDHEDDEDDEDNKYDKFDKDNEDEGDEEDVGAFSNEVEGGVPSAPHSTLIKRLHILNQTPTYQRSDTKKDEIDLLIKQLHQMKSRGEIGRMPCGLGRSWTYKTKANGRHRIGRMIGQSRKFIPELSAQAMLYHSSK
jgi:hypothetical protein